jgi:2'-5' RNA ligase
MVRRLRMALDNLHITVRINGSAENDLLEEICRYQA